MPHEAIEHDTARLIVCEQRGRWAVALRRELVDAKVRLVETRSLDDAWQRLHRWPASLVVYEFSPTAAGELLDRLATMTRRLPLARAVVVAARRHAAFEWLLREAGAAHVVFSPRRLGALRGLVARHFARVPTAEAPWAQQLWQSLPWGRES